MYWRTSCQVGHSLRSSLSVSAGEAVEERRVVSNSRMSDGPIYDGPVSKGPMTVARRARLEILAFLFLTAVLMPALAVATVGGYGFAVWIYQMAAGPPGPPHR